MDAKTYSAITYCIEIIDGFQMVGAGAPNTVEGALEVLDHLRVVLQTRIDAEHHRREQERILARSDS